MTTVKEACKKHSCTVNDVLMAALTGALRRYGGDICGDSRLKEGGGKLDFKSMVMIALPRPIDESDMMSALCNNVLFASCPLPIDEPTAAGRLRRTMATFNNLKSTAYVSGLICLTNLVKGVAPTGMLRKAVSETFSKHSLLVTNVPGPTIPFTFPKVGGEVMGEVHMVFPNIVPQLSFISYNGFVYGNIVADPGLFPKLDKLAEMYASEFEALKEVWPESSSCESSDESGSDTSA